MAVDALELQLASALQRYTTLQRRAETTPEARGLLTRSLAELGTALEEVRVAQEQIVQDRLRLEELMGELRAQCTKYWELFDEMPDPYLVTRPDTTIVEVNQAAAHLFNVSQRFLTGKTLSVFICEDRGRFLDESGRIARDKSNAELRLKLRPRERAPLTIAASVHGDGQSLRWILRPAGPVGAVSEN